MSRHIQVLAAGILAASLYGLQATAQAETPAAGDQKPTVVAIINGETISRQQLGEEARRRYGEEVLESLINKHLIQQECVRRGTEITHAEVDAEVERTASKWGISTERWLQMLRDERNIDASEYKRDIIWPTLALRTLVNDSIQVTQEEFDQAFVNQFGDSVQCRIIMVSDREKIYRLHAEAKADPPRFQVLAKEESEDEISASVRGIIRPIRRHSGDPELEEVAFSLQPNEISEPQQIGDQWIILQCVRHIPGQTPSAQAMPFIRQQIEDQIRDRKIQPAAAELFQQLQRDAQVVNVMNDPSLRSQHPGVAALVNGRPITIASVTEECIKRNGADVLEGEINRVLLDQALRNAGVTVEQTDLDEEIARAADTYGYLKHDGTPDVVAWLKSVTESEEMAADLYVRDAVWPSVALKKLVETSVEVTDEDLRKGFESNFGRRVEILAIVLADQKKAYEVWKLARENPTDEAFGELAAQYSIEPVSKANFGKVPPIRRYGGQPTIENEAFSLQPGELSGIVAAGSQFTIMRCQGFTEPVVKEFAAVRDELTRDITEKKMRVAMAKKFDELKASAQIDNFLTGQSQPGTRVAARAGK